MGLSIIILAAGAGSRLKSTLPKVLHEVGGKPLLQHVLDAAKALEPDTLCVVVGFGASAIRARFEEEAITWVTQPELKGTGDAVLQALPFIQDERVMVLYGDVPLVLPSTLASLAAISQGVGLLTAHVEDPTGYGRIVRHAGGSIVGIVEEKDASPAQKRIDEVNSGMMVLPVRQLKTWLSRLTNKNASGEYYLTDIIAMAVSEKITMTAIHPSVEEEIYGVNTRAQLSTLENFYQEAHTDRLMDEGVTFRDPARFDMRGNLNVEQDVIFDVNVICEGDVSIGEGSIIGPDVILKNVTIGKHVEIRAFCHIEEAVIKDHAIIGPFARIRPETVIEEHARIGNFVEVKKSMIGEGSKINHLSYIGDASLGKHVNVGAGTITCNYDGVNKHHTTVEDDVFIGSNTALVAPLTIGKGATIAAGSTLTKNAPSGQLTLSRTPQKTIPEWKRPLKNKEKT